MRSISHASPHRVYVALALAFGLAFVLLTPPFMVVDEYVHFYRSYHISEGAIAGIGANGGYGAPLPASLTQFAATVSRNHLRGPGNVQDPGAIVRELNRPLAPDVRVFTDFRGTSAYSPVPYLAQAGGIALGRTLGAPPVVLLYLGRLANLLLSILLTYLAIRTTPVFKWVFLVLALTPMTLSLAGSLSADAPTNAASFALIAACLQAALRPGSAISRKQLLAMSALAAVLTLCKPAYVPLLGLYFLIPRLRFGSGVQYVVAGLWVLVAALLPAAAWMVWSLGQYVPNQLDGTIQPAAQLAGIIANPLSYFGVLLTSYGDDLFKIGLWFIGNLGWEDTLLPLWAYFAFTVGTVFLALTDGSPSIPIGLSAKVLLGVVVLGATIVVATSAYVLWTPIGAEYIHGLQGRYFIPIAPVLFLLLYNNRLRPLRGAATVFAATLASSMLIVALLSLVQRYYGI